MTHNISPRSSKNNKKNITSVESGGIYAGGRALQLQLKPALRPRLLTQRYYSPSTMDNHFQNASHIPVGAEERRDLYAAETLHHQPKCGTSDISADEIMTDEYDGEDDDTQEGVAAGFYPPLRVEVDERGKPISLSFAHHNDSSEDGKLFTPRSANCSSSPV